MPSERYVHSLLVDISTVYEGEQEAFRHSGVEILREHRETETYGTMEGNPRRAVVGEQG